MAKIDELALIEEIRKFNRFYTEVLGLLNRHYLDSGYSLTEVRILFELNQKNACTANDVIRKLKLDPSYMSRIVTGFQKAGLIERHVSKIDGRARTITLTKTGKSLIDDLIQHSNGEIGRLVRHLNDEECGEVHQAILTLEKYFESKEG